MAADRVRHEAGSRSGSLRDPQVEEKHLRGMQRVALAVAVLAACGMTAAIALGAGAESSAAGSKVRILSDSQTALQKGLRAKVTAKHAGTVEVRGFSSTFDTQKFKPLTKTKRITFDSAGQQVVKLPLNKS